MRNRRVTVNDVFSVPLRKVEELAANPYEIVGVLPFDWNARTNAGMDKQEISAAKTVAKASQEQIACARKDAAKAPLQLQFRLKRRARPNPVGCQGLHAAKLPPMTKAGRISKKVFQNG